MVDGEGEFELTIDRIFDAPVDLVWEAWTDRDRTIQWKCPRGLTNTVLEMDVREGGEWRQCMQAPDGTEYWRSGVYREIEPHERLVFTYVTDDPRGAQGQETVVTVTFEDRGDQTRVVLHQAGFDTEGSRDAHQGGWSSALEKLGEHLAEVGS